jgi:predicted nucleic acid-binding protein
MKQLCHSSRSASWLDGFTPETSVSVAVGPSRRSSRRTRSVIPGGRDVAAKWGEIVAYAVKRGRPRPFNDSWIAASCLTYDRTLATLNVTDFEDFTEFEGLRLITP